MEQSVPWGLLVVRGLSPGRPACSLGPYGLPPVSACLLLLAAVSGLSSLHQLRVFPSCSARSHLSSLIRGEALERAGESGVGVED